MQQRQLITAKSAGFAGGKTGGRNYIGAYIKRHENAAKEAPSLFSSDKARKAFDNRTIVNKLGYLAGMQQALNTEINDLHDQVREMIQFGIEARALSIIHVHPGIYEELSERLKDKFPVFGLLKEYPTVNERPLATKRKQADISTSTTHSVNKPRPSSKKQKTDPLIGWSIFPPYPINGLGYSISKQKKETYPSSSILFRDEEKKTLHGLKK